MIGRSGSKGFPNKNIKKILGKRLCEYSLMAEKNLNMLTKFLYQQIVLPLSQFLKNMGQQILIDQKN